MCDVKALPDTRACRSGRFGRVASVESSDGSRSMALVCGYC